MLSDVHEHDDATKLRLDFWWGVSLSPHFFACVELHVVPEQKGSCNHKHGYVVGYEKGINNAYDCCDVQDLRPEED